MTPGAEPARLLLVEDNPGDVDLVREALAAAGARVELHTAADGEAALQRLRTGALPDLVLLDLNVPRMDGREVLGAIKSDERLRHLPVIVLSSSDAEHDRAHAYRLQASCFVTKPVDLDEFFAVMRAFVGFWLGVVKLPPRAQ